MIKKLTPKQKKFYDLLKNYIEENASSPTVAELVKLVKASSPRAVTQYLSTLEKKGFITRKKYEPRGIFLKESVKNTGKALLIPVIASAGCDNVNVLAQEIFDEYVCVPGELLRGRKKERVVSIRAVGDSMVDAGINENDYVLVEVTEAVSEGDIVVVIIDGFAVIKKLEIANNALILRPVSSDPNYKPIVVRKDFKIFGKMVDVIRTPQKGEVEVVPVFSKRGY